MITGVKRREWLIAHGFLPPDPPPPEGTTEPMQASLKRAKGMRMPPIQARKKQSKKGLYDLRSDDALDYAISKP